MSESPVPESAPSPIDPDAPPPSPVTPVSGALLGRVLALLHRHPLLLPVASFAFGVGSFLLVQRGEHMARVMAVIALLGWPWLLAEGVLGRWFARRTRGRLPEATARFITQQVQQELLFFSLPFLFTAMSAAAPGQIAFVIAAGALAVASAIDPLYWHRIAPNPALSMAFHGGCSFVASLVTLPLAVHLPVEQALPIAFGITALTLLLSLVALLRQTADGAAKRRCLAVGTIAAALLVLMWLGRAAIPPAGLWVREARITTTLDGFVPGAAVDQVAITQLTETGLIAFVAVRAPRGLSQAVVFDWQQDGRLIDRIPAEITGGRDAGFRTYSRKLHFGEDPRGHWQVDLRTSQGQLIARRSVEIR